MPKSEIPPTDHIARIRASFEKKRAILLADYDHFVTPRTVVKPRGKRRRRSNDLVK